MTGNKERSAASRSPSRYGPAIKVEGASKRFGDIHALKNVDLEVKRGELFGLLGPNGAGKSTLIKALLGSVGLDSGRIRVLSLNPAADDLRIKAFTGYVPESESPPSFLRPDELLDFVMECRGLERSERTRSYWLELFDLSEQRGTIARDLSKGTRQKLMLASAMVHSPELLLLDEPFINLDPIYQRKARDLLRAHCEKGGTVLISTHILSLAEELCGRVMMMDHGSVVLEGATSDIVSSHGSLEEAFLRTVGYYSK